MLRKFIIEAGLLNNGMLVVRRQYIDTNDLLIHPILVGEILSVIQHFSETSHDAPNVIQIDPFLICLHQFIVKEKSNFLLYTICQVNPQSIHNLLINLADELKTFEPILLNWNLDTESIGNLFPIFDEKFMTINKS
ncbi:hypothetical protein [Candidatus Hodarchaeum mangrovi]